MLVSLRPTKIAPGGSWGGQKYPENTIKKAIMAHVAPNGWISMDLDWIWTGYIQDGQFFLENIYWTNSQAQVN